MLVFSSSMLNSVLEGYEKVLFSADCVAVLSFFYAAEPGFIICYNNKLVLGASQYMTGIYQNIGLYHGSGLTGCTYGCEK